MANSEKEKFFWFKLHSGDFLTETSLYSARQIGCYILLKIYLTRNMRLPGKMAELRRICKNERADIINSVLCNFAVDSLGYYDLDIADQKLKAAEKSFKNKISGRAGARERWKGKNK